MTETRHLTGATVGVIGAGTMGQGIAQIATLAGHPVRLFDANSALTPAALSKIATRIDRKAEKAEIPRREAERALAGIQVCDNLSAMAECLLIVEAIKEDLAIKREMFASLEDIVRPGAILTSNTSSISITALGSGLRHPERFCGLHFFNPAPLMPLVEVIPGLDTSAQVAAELTALMIDWGKSPVRAPSTPGFIVNRVARPFYAEALEILGEGAASPAQIDAALRGAGYRMGPFELMDMIGHDVNFAVTHSTFHATFEDVRYRPSSIQQELVDGGRLGRKSGRGFYEYEKGSRGPSHPDPTPVELVESQRIETGSASLHDALLRANVPAILTERLEGWTILDGIALTMTDGAPATGRTGPDGLTDVVLHDLVQDWGAQGPLAIAASESANPEAIGKVAWLLSALNRQPVIMGDVAGLAVARTVAMLVAEAAEAVTRGVSAHDVDQAMKLGAGHRTPPLAWCDALGARTFVKILQNLEDCYRDGRHRIPPLLSRIATSGRSFRPAGEVA